jgi:hypothetical protein
MGKSSHNIPQLGKVSFEFLSLGLLIKLSESVQDVDEKQRPYTLTERVLSASIEEPELKPEDISKLPQDALKSLIDIAIDEGEIREEFDQISQDFPYTERFYQALLVYLGEANRTIREAVSQAANAIAQHQTVVNQSIANITQAFIQQINQLQVDVNRSLASIWETFKQYQDQTEAASRDISGLLVQAGFWFPPSGSLRLIHAIRELKSQGQATPENVRQLVVEYYEQDDYSNLRNMVNTWGENPYFANRMHIITDALEAHIDGKFTLSIPTLLPLVEGVLTDIVGRRATRADGGISGWAGTAIDTMYLDSFRESSKDALIAFITGSSVYGSIDPTFFTPSAFSTWLANQGLDGKQILQRHAILHGVQTDYDSKENSLRAFLILDVLSWLKREEWDKKLQSILNRRR